MIATEIQKHKDYTVITVSDSYGKKIFKSQFGDKVLAYESGLLERLPYLLENVYKLGREDTLLQLTLERMAKP